MKILTSILILPLILSALIGSVIFFNFNNDSRPLTEQEVEVLRSVFYESVIYSKVVISTANLPPTMAAFVLADHIIYREEYHLTDFSDDYLKMARLIHEIGHVWANQSQGLHSSLIALSEHFIYQDQVYAHKKLTGQKALNQFRYEQQCRILSDYYVNRQLGFDISAYEATIYKTIKIL